MKDKKREKSETTEKQPIPRDKELPAIINEFDSYKIYYYSQGKVSNNPPKKYSIQSATIYCYWKNKVVGRIEFHDHEAHQPLEPNKYDNPFAGANKVPWINFHLSKFDDIIKVLRYEKPLVIGLNPNNLWGYITTGYEPVGEQE